MPYADYFPKGISNYVPNCEYAIDTDIDNRLIVLDMGSPLALSTNGLLAAHAIATAATTISALTSGAGTATAIGFNGMVPYNSTTEQRLAHGGGWGRALTLTGSATTARVATVVGADYLGQKMVENFTLNATTAVQGLKAFAWIESITVAAGTDTPTLTVGYNNKLGLPFAGDSMFNEIKNSAVAANAGTFVGGLLNATTATATNADTRGTYLPATVLPDGANTFKISYMKRSGNLHGNAQFAG
jgi:hypothetical protein